MYFKQFILPNDMEISISRILLPNSKLTNHCTSNKKRQ